MFIKFQSLRFLIITGFEMVKDVPLELYGLDHDRSRQRQDPISLNRDNLNRDR